MRRSFFLCCLMLIAGSGLSCRSVIAPTGSAAYGQQTSSSTLKEKLQEMKQAGLPTTPQELQAPLPPNAQNAAPLYRQLVALLKTRPTVGDDKTATDGVGLPPMTAEQAKKLRKAFQNRADIGRLIHQAVARPDCVFDRQWAQGTSMLFPEFAKMRMAARWLSAESALQLYDGKPLVAVQTEALGFRVAFHAAKDPMLIAYLVANAIDAITLRGMERILYAAGDQPGVALAIQQAIEAGAQPRSLAHGFRGEFILPLVELDKNRKISPDAYEKSAHAYGESDLPKPFPPLSAADKQNWGQFVDRSETAMLRMQHQMINLADRPYQEAQRGLYSVTSDLSAHAHDAAYNVARIIYLVYSQALTKRAQMAAKVAAVRAGAAILAWKVKHKTLPATLEMAMPHIPLDPFNGQPMRYQKSGNTFIIYSVGPTGHFDGGAATVKPNAMETVFRYPMPVYFK